LTAVEGKVKELNLKLEEIEEKYKKSQAEVIAAQKEGEELNRKLSQAK